MQVGSTSETDGRSHLLLVALCNGACHVWGFLLALQQGNTV